MAGLFNMTGGCPWPFLPILDYPYTGGLQQSRYCQESFFGDGIVCCLPCPVTDWIYEDNFDTVSTMTNWLSVGGFICCVFLLLSFLCLPVARTSRHYLTIGLVIGVALVNLGFIVSLLAKPHQCYDAITVNDMYTSLACAWSGALVLFGGNSAVVWVFNRSLSLHLQICWSKIPGKKSFYAAHFVGWGIPALITGISLGLSGVAFRFGNVCHINHDNSLATFWGPTLFFAATAAILQTMTLIYVLKVYLRNLWDPTSNSGVSSSMRSAPPTNGPIQSGSVRATYRRVMKVLALQWRGIVVVIIVLVSAVYFAVIFNIFDQLGTVALKDRTRTRDWVICIVLHGGDKSQCLDKARSFSLNESIVSAVLVLLSLMGYWCLLFLGRLSMFVGWWEMIKKPFHKKDGFVSVDAKRVSDPQNYDMLLSPPQSYHLTKSEKGGLIATAKPITINSIPVSTFNKELLDFQSEQSPVDYIEPQLPPPTKNYEGRVRENSFSQPRAPARTNSQRQRVIFEDEARARAEEMERFREQHNASVLAYASPISTSTQQVNEYTPQENNPYTALTRSPSSMSNNAHGRSNSALGRERPIPTSRANTTSPTPYRSNSRTGAGSALSSRANAREWDHPSTYTRQ